MGWEAASQPASQPANQASQPASRKAVSYRSEGGRTRLRRSSGRCEVAWHAGGARAVGRGGLGGSQPASQPANQPSQPAREASQSKIQNPKDDSKRARAHEGKSFELAAQGRLAGERLEGQSVGAPGSSPSDEATSVVQAARRGWLLADRAAMAAMMAAGRRRRESSAVDRAPPGSTNVTPMPERESSATTLGFTERRLRI